jgi:nucleotide-binding universal stress UspA family protein
MNLDSIPLPKKILVAVEGSEPSLKESSMKAARYAIQLAVLCKADLTGICVIQIPEYIEEHTRAILRQELLGKSNSTLDEIQEIARKSNVNYGSQTLETSGAIATAVCNFAEKAKIELLILGTRSGTSNLTKVMLGSVAAGVVGNASCPVLVVR